MPRAVRGAQIPWRREQQPLEQQRARPPPADPGKQVADAPVRSRERPVERTFAAQRVGVGRGRQSIQDRPRNRRIQLRCEVAERDVERQAQAALGSALEQDGPVELRMCPDDLPGVAHPEQQPAAGPEGGVSAHVQQTVRRRQDARRDPVEGLTAAARPHRRQVPIGVGRSEQTAVEGDRETGSMPQGNVPRPGIGQLRPRLEPHADQRACAPGKVVLPHREIDVVGVPKGPIAVGRPAEGGAPEQDRRDPGLGQRREDLGADATVRLHPQLFPDVGHAQRGLERLGHRRPVAPQRAIEHRAEPPEDPLVGVLAPDRVAQVRPPRPPGAATGLSGIQTGSQDPGLPRRRQDDRQGIGEQRRPRGVAGGGRHGRPDSFCPASAAGTGRWNQLTAEFFIGHRRPLDGRSWAMLPCTALLHVDACLVGEASLTRIRLLSERSALESDGTRGTALGNPPRGSGAV